MTPGERILFVIDHLKISKNKFSTKMLGLSASTKIDHIIKGRNDITPDFATEICKVVPEINYDWLLKDEGEPFTKQFKFKDASYNYSKKELNNLADTIIEYEDDLIEIPKIKKMIERHALIMLNEKLPDLIDRIYQTKLKSQS
ncbi:MAG: hypothetical protein CL613_11080 [Aquimarina sp.]|nr:hypothetical protein [Aquimarina sp.]